MTCKLLTLSNPLVATIDNLYSPVFAFYSSIVYLLFKLLKCYVLFISLLLLLGVPKKTVVPNFGDNFVKS